MSFISSYVIDTVLIEGSCIKRLSNEESIYKSKNIILCDILYSSFSHVVRIFSIISRVVQQHPDKYTFVITLPKTISSGLKKFIYKECQEMFIKIIIISLNSEQVNLNTSRNLIKALKESTHSSWIKSMRKLYIYLSPKIVLMSPALFGNYYHDLQQGTQKVLGIIDVYYTPWSLGKIGVSPKITHKNKVLQFLMTKIINIKLFDPFFIGIQYQWCHSGILKKSIPKTMKEHFLLYDKLLFPDISGWEPLIKNPDISQHKYSYIGPLLPQYKKKTFKQDDLQIKQFKKQGGGRKVVTILLGGSFFVKKHKTFVNFVKLLITEVRLTKDTLFLVVLGQHEQKFKQILMNHTNVMVISHFVPFDIIFKYTDVALATLGQGTVMEAIKSSVRLVGLPINADQYSHGQRLEYFKIGQLIQKHFPWQISDNTVFYRNITRKFIVRKITQFILDELNLVQKTDNFQVLKEEIIQMEKKQRNNILGNLL